MTKLSTAALVLSLSSLFIGSVASAQTAAYLTATPNPCIAPWGQALCTTQVSWNGGSNNATVYVTVLPYGQPQLMASAPYGSVTVPWIRVGTSYRFDVWVLRNGGFGQSRTRVATTTVTGLAGNTY